MKKLIISVWIVVMSYVIIDMAYDYYRYYTLMNMPVKEIKVNVDTPIAKIAVEADNSLEWELVGKVIALILVTYGGIKIINKKIT